MKRAAAAKDEEVKLGSSDDWLASGSNRAGRQPSVALEMTSALAATETAASSGRRRQ
jgi:hypothetical protein